MKLFCEDCVKGRLSPRGKWWYMLSGSALAKCDACHKTKWCKHVPADPLYWKEAYATANR